MKTRGKVWKRVTAIALAVIMVAVSLPLALAAVPAEGSYDPTPTFAPDAALWAWTTEEGTVKVAVPVATPVTSYITDKSIETYYITLYDLGAFTDVHQDPATQGAPSVQIVKAAGQIATLSEDDTFEVEFGAQELQNFTAAGGVLDGTHRLSVEVLAQDSTGWVSEPITTVVSDIPQFVYDAESYAPITENATGMREMMMFESRNNDNVDYVSENGAGGGRLDFIQTGDQLQFLGRTDQAGEENADGSDSAAYGFRVTGTGAQSFNTTWSRQHWVGSGAEEVWFWFDLSQVSVEGLAFELKTQGKRYGERYSYWGNYDGFVYNSGADDEYSVVTYSTKGTNAAGYDRETFGDPYVLLQQEDGSWQKVMLENGTMDLANYKGYIRVPIQFLCSTTDTYAEAPNNNFGEANVGTNSDLVNEWSQIVYDAPVLVDPAGTPISNALLLQYRLLVRYNIVNSGVGKSQTEPKVETPSTIHGWGASMLAIGYGTGDYSTSNPRMAYVDGNREIQNRGTIDESTGLYEPNTGGYKAIDDFCGAGFSYESMSEDSLRRTFFLDSVMLYKTTGDYPLDMDENGDHGLNITNYYDQRLEIPRSILNRIEELIATPDLADFRAVQYIDDLINAYRTTFDAAGADTAFLEESNLEAVAAQLGMADVWQTYVDARDACLAGGTIRQEGNTYVYPSNNTAYDLVPTLIQSLEKLPDASTVTEVSERLDTEIRTLWDLYRRLNLTQLDAMSREEEEKLYDYLRLVRATEDEMLAGTSLATNKFLLFNDFESLSAGANAKYLEDSPSLSQGQDYRYSEGFVFSSMTFRDFAGHSDPAIGSIMGDTSQDSYSNGLYDGLNTAAADAVVATDVGARGSKGARVTIDGRYLTGDNGNPKGYVNAVSVTRNSAASSTGGFDGLPSIADWQLSRFAESWSASDSRDYPVGLIFYVDLSELAGLDFLLSINIATVYDGHPEGYNLDMDMSGSEQEYMIMNMETGEWVPITGTGSPYGFTSKGGSSSIGTLADGYKGYLYVALNKFERSTAVGTVDLCNMGEQIDNIRRVELGVMPLTTDAANAMDGKSFVIDDVGFAYGGATYDAGVTAELNHPTFEQVMGMKSTAARDFEAAVSKIELNDVANFANYVAEARTLYDNLSQYQKDNMLSVQTAYAQLEYYEKIVAGTEVAPTPKLKPAEFLEMVAALPEGLKTASTTGDYDLPYPGVKDTDGDGQADTPKYEAYDPAFTMEMADKIIENYNNTYSLYTKAQKEALGEAGTQFLNAYNAAMRCNTTLTKVLQEGDEFLNELFTLNEPTSLYRTMSELYPDKANSESLGTAGDGTVYAYDAGKPYGTHVTADGEQVDEGYFISLTDRDPLNEISSLYRNETDYYAKVLLADGSLMPGVNNIPMAVRKLLNNSAQYTNAAGETVYGGVRTLFYRYRDLYNAAKAKVDAGTALEQSELEALLLAIDEYEALIPTYHDVSELYNLIQQIYDLFPAVATTLTATGAAPDENQTILLSYDGEAAKVENAVDPVYTLTQFEQYLTDLSGKGTLTITSKNGGKLLSADGTAEQAYTLTYGGAEVNFASGAYTAGEYDAPMQSGAAIHVAIDDPHSFPMELSDVVTLTFTYQYLDRHGILREVKNEKTVTIRYATDDMYEVTVPAEVEIPWNATSVQAGYTMTCNLNDGSSVAVGLASDAAFALTADGTDKVINCTADAPAAASYTGTQIEVAGTNPMTISVAETEWNDKPIGAYRAADQITYTVTYTEGITP